MEEEDSKPYLDNQEDGDPLVVGVVKRVPVMLPLGAGAFEGGRDVEVGVHPAVAVQHTLVHSPIPLQQT